MPRGRHILPFKVRGQWHMLSIDVKICKQDEYRIVWVRTIKLRKKLWQADDTYHCSRSGVKGQVHMLKIKPYKTK